MKNPLKVYLAKQLGHPSGWFGRFLVRMLNRENASMNQLVLDKLGLQHKQHILEIGFGGGDLIHRLLHAHVSPQITGIDPASASIASCQRRFKQSIAQGQLSLHRTQAEAMPFPKETFDAIATVNTLYFWSDVSTVLQECHRVLKPHRRIAIAYNSKAFLEQNQMTRYGFRAYEASDIQTQMQKVGFGDVQTVSRKSVSNGTFLCTCGVKAEQSMRP